MAAFGGCMAACCMAGACCMGGGCVTSCGCCLGGGCICFSTAGLGLRDLLGRSFGFAFSTAGLGSSGIAGSGSASGAAAAGRGSTKSSKGLDQAAAKKGEVRRCRLRRRTVHALHG